MLNQSGWGGGSSGSPFGQDMDLAGYLAQEGFFQKGTFWSHIATETVSVPEPTSTVGLLGFSLLGLGLRRTRKSN
ncbi:MAG: PEP-CTERM sorting domain-containing protein [Cyanobacteria bacterium J06635_10]